MKKILATILSISFVFSFVLQNINLFSNTANAQMIQNTQGAPCVNLSYNMTIGSRDSNTEGEVSKLQIFLMSTGFLNHEPTGYFGVLTRTALAKYQSVNGISPAAGYFGVITKSFINKDTCSGYVPSNPSSKPTYYCDLNGASYLNENDYKKNCVSTIIQYTCSTTGQTYNSQSQYDIYCPNNIPVPNPNPTTYYCSINGQIYYNINDYNNYCKNQNQKSLPICNLNTNYNNTKSCICPNGYTFLNTGNVYKCDNTPYPCTTLYVDPSATSTNYDRCHYPYYCSLDGLYHNNASYCKSPNTQNTQNTQNYICLLNYEYQGGGFVATNDCVCPNGSTKINLGNFGEIYKWKCVSNIY